MQDFDSILADADTKIMDVMGKDGTYARPSASLSEPVKVTIDKDVSVIGDDGVSIVTQTQASLIKPDMGCRPKDEITVGGQKYQVVRPMSDDGSVVVLSVNPIS